MFFAAKLLRKFGLNRLPTVSYVGFMLKSLALPIEFLPASSVLSLVAMGAIWLCLCRICQQYYALRPDRGGSPSAELANLWRFLAHVDGGSRHIGPVSHLRWIFVVGLSSFIIL